MPCWSAKPAWACTYQRRFVLPRDFEVVKFGTRSMIIILREKVCGEGRYWSWRLEARTMSLRNAWQRLGTVCQRATGIPQLPFAAARRRTL
jgi:hypothetical protein